MLGEQIVGHVKKFCSGDRVPEVGERVGEKTQILINTLTQDGNITLNTIRTIKNTKSDIHNNMIVVLLVANILNKSIISFLKDSFKNVGDTQKNN